jgi:putative transposase
MPRKPRVLEPNRVYHVFNRRTDRQLLFPSPSAYDEFLDVLHEGRQRYNIRVCAYCPLQTHWHQAIWIREHDGVAPVISYLRWLSSKHALRFRRVSGTRGNGHVYQDRYKAVHVGNDWHYLTLIRYIEANPLAAGLVKRAQDWPWSSLAERLGGSRRILSKGPVPIPADWADIVNARCPTAETVSGDGGSSLRDGGRRPRGRRFTAAGTEVATRGDGGVYNPLL